jgi:DNA-nicking Smr family endonuclease
MVKKKRVKKKSSNSFDSNPFKHLKGFAVSAPEELPSVPEPAEPPPAVAERSFTEEMDFLGVDPLSARQVESQDDVSGKSLESSDVEVKPLELQTDEELFLESLGQFETCFRDSSPAEVKLASPRRLKQLKQGRLTPDASLDLHGLQRHQVADKIGHFLQDAAHQRWKTLLIVTGRGLHSVDGQPVLRDEAERFFAGEGKKLIAEWGRAPRQYGGEGALVVFLKKALKE